MLIKKIDDIAAAEVKMEGVRDASVRVVFGPADGAATFAMRVFELAGDGHTPFHTHPFEHEVVILEGEIGIVTEEGTKPLAVGDYHCWGQSHFRILLRAAASASRSPSRYLSGRTTSMER